ncbi:MAG: class C sortase [Clostridia bacterium]|nr:class C sortase [Clostridia bacterium]
MKKKSNLWVNLALILIFLVGLGLLIYPSFSEYWNSFHQSRAIVSYAEKVAEINNEEYERIWNSALAYNETLVEKENRWFLDEEEVSYYETLLNVDGTGNMGYISVPRANINLPLYHGTSEGVLQTSVGHIEGTSLPVGSLHPDEENFDEVPYGSHCVLSGHRGLPSARLFSDLDVMEIGDVFYLTILDQTLTYQIDKITVIEPTDLSELQIEPGLDLCTLMTCTPYGINTHRLLVRGRRVENEKPQMHVRVTADGIRIETAFVAPFLAIPVLLILIINVFIVTSRFRRRRKVRK